MQHIEQARQSIITPAMREVARTEGVDEHFICRELAAGRIIIPRNRRRTGCRAVGIGNGLATKINANIGTSKDCASLDEELQKLDVAVGAGADTIMDLSTGGDLDGIRKEILRRCPVPLGTVPIYQAAIETVRSGKQLVDMDAEDLFRVIQRHAEDGVDFITVHCGLTRHAVELVRQQGRLMDVVSRGGSFTVAWMLHNQKENPLYEHYDRLLDIAAAYDMTLSLGDGLRPGCIADATDRGQIQELITLGELARRALERGVQVMIEGPGHVPIHQIQTNIQLQKSLCSGAPFYVLGPLVTDAAPGYDHITSAIGGAIAAAAGADFLCYVTPSEHLRLPTVEDVREGVIAAKIAAHAADIAKGRPQALERDRRMAQCRKKMDWEGQIQTALDPNRARQLRESRIPADRDVCTMCGEFCAIKVLSAEKKC
ncbi:MAG: phosphomethylpyrimidine synthase ThiC [Desulfobacterota bacterium]|nr:phosphomethylpyrimidine synthase ThiC [Thermodesulfobacteriota bacterium]